MTKFAVLLAVVLGMAQSDHVQALGAGSTRELAVEIAYRLDRELGEVDAAQRHLLIWRLLTAQADGELAVGESISDRWLEWQQTLEQLERRLDLSRLPAWYGAARPDEVTNLLAAEIAEAESSQWLPPIDSPSLAAAGVRLVTDREDVLAASAQYPALLAWARSHAAEIWVQMLDRLAVDPELLPLLEPLFSPWLALPLESPLSSWRQLKDVAAGELDQLYRKGTHYGDPLQALDEAIADLEQVTARQVQRNSWSLPLARYGLFLNRDTADDLDRAILSLADGVERIESGGFQELVRSLVSMSYLLIMRVDMIDSRSRAEAVLERLGRLDRWLLPQLGRIDQRLLSVYQQSRLLLRDWQDQTRSGTEEKRGLHLRTLAALNASLELTAADIEAYLSQPFREVFEISLVICFAQGVAEAPFPAVPISLQDYLDCAENFAAWANGDAAMPELAGESVGRFEVDHRQRELDMIPAQRINYWFGFIADQLGSNCKPEVENALANPFEWALSARAFVWLADRWPAYYLDRGLQSYTEGLIETGRNLLHAQDQLIACFKEAASDPILVLINDYRENLDIAAAAIDQATIDFRTVQLKPGADVVLDGGVNQITRYHPADRPVGACNQQPSCDMSDQLEATRALYELFSAAYRLADQTGMGDISLCYANVQWVQRRADVPSTRIRAMANYFGRLSFELHGKFSGQLQPTFRLRLVGNSEHEYLFGENSPEVLDNPCPRDLINTQVQAELPERRLQLVPRRLTYMTADRMHPARVFDQHWADGDEWRDWFVTGNEIEVLERNDDADLDDRVNARLRTLNSGWNREVYRQMLEGDGIDLDGQSELGDAMRAVDLSQRTLVAVASLLMPERIKSEAALRESLFGHNGLFGRRVALHMQNNNVPVQMTAQLARSHLEDAQFLWQRQARRSVRRVEQTNSLVSTTLLELAALQDRY